MPNNTFRLTLQSTYEESERVPDFVEGLQSKSSLTDDETSTLMLLLSEAVTNAIKHGNLSDASKKVNIRIQINDDVISTKVTDEGEGFDPESLKDPLKEENLLDVSGRGIFLIKELSDAVEFDDDGRTILFEIHR